MDHRQSRSAFDETSSTSSSFSLVSVSTSLAQKLRAAKKAPLPSSAPDDDDVALKEAKAARYQSYMRRTNRGIDFEPSAQDRRLASTKLCPLDVGGLSSSSSFSSSASDCRAHTPSRRPDDSTALVTTPSRSSLRPPTVRLAATDHDSFETLRRVLRDLFQKDYGPSFFHDVANADEYSRLAFVGSDCVGAVACRVQDDDGDRRRPLEVVVVAMGVLPEHRRRGVGTKLMNHVEDASFRNKKVGRLRLAVHQDNTSAINLYEKQGFQKLSSCHDVWTMIYELHSARFQ